jgi:hypothetical protein
LGIDASDERKEGRDEVDGRQGLTRGSRRRDNRTALHGQELRPEERRVSVFDPEKKRT